MSDLAIGIIIGLLLGLGVLIAAWPHRRQPTAAELYADAVMAALREQSSASMTLRDGLLEIDDE